MVNESKICCEKDPKRVTCGVEVMNALVEFADKMVFVFFGFGIAVMSFIAYNNSVTGAHNELGAYFWAIEIPCLIWFLIMQIRTMFSIVSESSAE